MGERKAEKIRSEHVSYELKWAGERDVDDYKNECEKKKRDSLSNRNKKGFRIRQDNDERKAEKIRSEHVSYELKWAGERDVDDYKNECEKKKRDSLSNRNKEGFR